MDARLHFFHSFFSFILSTSEAAGRFACVPEMVCVLAKDGVRACVLAKDGVRACVRAVYDRPMSDVRGNQTCEG